jgi:hypothetical protein
MNPHVLCISNRHWNWNVVMWPRGYRLFSTISSTWLTGPPPAFIVKIGWVCEGDKWQARSHLNLPKGWGGKINYNPLPIIQLKIFLTQPGPPSLFNFIFLKGCLSLGYLGIYTLSITFGFKISLFAVWKEG